ncbi:carbonic anhydrase family protein [Pacificimonas sp. WHA3]|uniref:Carbonic anhydrase family protein n=1 Tax=Pacificimonas pallii TaxID=2827236 RepID=A0ABS6SDD7_9SPHN|nr:carbonic anhydrase family protein [Pacificimonas pallii]MBV7256423.1 carbonic anhydrase family protein [Pacificimonas pallii]
MTTIPAFSKLALTPIALALAGAGAATAADWGYEGPAGPASWGDLSAEYEMCKIGRMQSPIDLAAANAQGDVHVSVAYDAGALTVLNNGHTVQANFDAGSTMTSGDMTFDLVQVHFHTPSEEAIAGKRYPMVGHFVHADSEGRLAVLGILFEEGAANAELQKIVDAAPADKTPAHTISGTMIDPNGMLPGDMGVYRFQGSLTTPPCSEGVNWHVVKQPVTASASQLAAMTDIMGNNARPLQPLHGRLVVAPAE